jgi:hypothetical protein
MNNTQSRIKIQNRFSEPINVKNGVQQEHALACLLFNTVLEKVIRDAAVNTRGTIFHKSVQFLAYVNDIAVIGRSQSAMIETFTNLEKAAKDMNLFINQEKTKCMPVTKKSHANYPHHLEVGSYTFQVTHSFTHLGSDVNCNNGFSAENQKHILTANRYFHGLRKQWRSCLTSETY